MVLTPPTETCPLRTHPSSDVRITLSYTLPLQQAVGWALLTPFHSHLEDKGTRETKRREREQRASLFSHKPQPRTASSEMLMHFIAALYRPKELRKASVANIGSCGSSEKGKVLEPGMGSFLYRS